MIMTATLILKNRLPNKSNSSFPFHCRLDTNLGGGEVQKSITKREALITVTLSIFSTKKENKLGKNTLHLQPYRLFGFCLDCYIESQNSLDQSKLRPTLTPNHPPLGIFWSYHFFCTKHKIVENEK